MTRNAIVVKVGQSAVAGRGERITTLGLGSCVAIMLHDPAVAIGGMAHVLLPEPFAGRAEQNPAKFALSAVPHLAAALREAGASSKRLEARLVGGASMFGSLMATGQTRNMGERNVIAARAALAELGIPVRAEDVGGDYGRSVHFDPGTGAVTVASVGRGNRVI